MKQASIFIFFLIIVSFAIGGAAKVEINPFRVYPYLQVYDSGKIQMTWMSTSLTSSSITLKDENGVIIFAKDITGEAVPEIFYTEAEKNQQIPGLEKGSWLLSDQAFRYQVQLDLPPGRLINYEVTLGGTSYQNQFKSPQSKTDWQKIRFVALADSETEPRGRVTHREWFPGQPLLRPFTIPQLWKEKFGFTVLEGYEIPNYMLTEQKGYAENLKVINSRGIDFMVMPGDLVQGGGYQPGWDEFFRHNAGEYDRGFSSYPVIPSFGNWENFGAINGGYGNTSDGKFAPVVSRNRYQAYFKTPVSDPLQKHGQSYYRSDYGPVTILTVDSSNGTPDQLTSDFDGVTKLKGKEFTVPGTDTQENYTEATYKARGGNDLSSFGPGSDQYAWLEANLKDAKESGQLIFIQYHHIAFSSGEHGVPLNHELSVGQVGTPMQVLNPLFEQYGVVAVLSGHDEIFERSFVDQDNDGKGVLYYDVGVAGDGIRAVKRDWKNNPLITLDYNPYSKWTADQNSVEQWNTSGTRPVLIDGGKHYGHLEVNLEKVEEAGELFALIKFTPVYIFPVLDEDYNLVKVERRVYSDEVNLKIKLNTTSYIPEFKELVDKKLDETGKAILVPADFLKNYTESEEISFTYSRSTTFSCEDLGLKEIQITAKNKLGETWVKVVKVNVIDDLKPILIPKNISLSLDRSKGQLILSADELIGSLSDNCGIKEVILSKDKITCEDIGKTLNIEIIAKDFSGNNTGAVAQVEVKGSNSQLVTISGNNAICPGGKTVLTLNSTASFEVIKWRRNGTEISGNAKTIEIGQAGNYDALIRYSGACLEETSKFEVKELESPGGTITKDNKTLVAPEASAYQWFRNGEKINGASGKTYLVTGPGEYTVELTNSLGCNKKLEIVVFTSEDFSGPEFPSVKSEMVLELDQDGKVTLKHEQLFEKWPLESGISVEITKTLFDCSNVGLNEVMVILKNEKNQTQEKKVIVLVKDVIPPTLVPKSLELSVDLTLGILELNVSDFYTELKDNCGIKEVNLNRTSLNCEDVGKVIPLVIRAVDHSGNVTEKVVEVTVKGLNSKPVLVSGKAEICLGTKSQLILNSEADFEVIRWRKNGVEIPNQKGKTLEIEEGGAYHAVVRYTSGCLSETEKFEVKTLEKPSGEIKPEGNKLVAPSGNYTYQWFRNGEAIAAATDRIFTLFEKGSYTVELTNPSGCKAMLKAVEVTIAGLLRPDVIQSEELKINPNPAIDRVEIQIKSDLAFELKSLKIYGFEGKELTGIISIAKISDSMYQLDISTLTPGNYLVLLESTNHKIFIGRFIKQ